MTHSWAVLPAPRAALLLTTALGAPYQPLTDRDCEVERERRRRWLLLRAGDVSSTSVGTHLVYRDLNQGYPPFVLRRASERASQKRQLLP